MQKLSNAIWYGVITANRNETEDTKILWRRYEIYFDMFLRIERFAEKAYNQRIADFEALIPDFVRFVPILDFLFQNS